jgi:hypothetical protein
VGSVGDEATEPRSGFANLAELTAEGRHCEEQSDEAIQPREARKQKSAESAANSALFYLARLPARGWIASP